MKLYVGVTDVQWFRFLAERQPDEVNFWRPSMVAFRVLEPGAPFLFKLRSPYNAIAGGGFFVRYTTLPLSLVWEAFQEKNGVASHAALLAKIRGYRKDDITPDPHIGVIVLAEPFFFEEAEWIPVPEDWSLHLVQGKSYDTSEEMGHRLWAQVRERLNQKVQPTTQAQLSLPGLQEQRYSTEYLTRGRLGQGAFRVLVTEAYQRRCAITGERTLPILQASHIQDYSAGGPHLVSNGLLLRADIHILFDRGYMTVTDDYHIEVSQRIKRDYGNGRDYLAMHGAPLKILPSDPQEQPSPEFLHWHQSKRFVA